MKKVKCIDDKGWYLTIGKIYEVIQLNGNDDYIIINDKGEKLWYEKEYFISLSEIRNEKINKLLEDES